MLRWIQRHQTLSAGILTAVAIIVAPVIGVWISSTQLKRPASDASVQPDRAEAPAAPGLATATKQQPEPAAPSPCERIDRTDQDVLTQSIFDVRDNLKEMIISRRHTRLEMDEIAEQYHGLKVIECGYISNMGASHDGGLYVYFDNKIDSDEAIYIHCLFDESWKNKIRTMDRTRRVLFEGIITTDTNPADIFLDECSLLKVE